MKEGGAARRIPRGPDRGGRHEMDICVGRTGTRRGSTDTRPTPNSMLSPRGALGSAGARAPCWVWPGSAWPPTGRCFAAAPLTTLCDDCGV